MSREGDSAAQQIREDYAARIGRLLKLPSPPAVYLVARRMLRNTIFHHCAICCRGRKQHRQFRIRSSLPGGTDTLDSRVARCPAASRA